jgi:hypothetical protein
LSDLPSRVHPFDRKTKRHALHFGEVEVRLADADLAQLHDTLVRLHSFPDPVVRRLCGRLRQKLGEGRADDAPLDLDVDTARKLQLAVYAEQAARKPVSAALAEARRQAFHFVERQHQVD